MPQMNMVQAINDALRIAMRGDDRVVIMGEDVGKVGGVFRVTAGLFDEFGDDRVIDTPLSENGIVGTAVGMALYGLVPVVEIQFADYIWPAMDALRNQVSSFRYRSNGAWTCPMRALVALTRGWTGTDPRGSRRARGAVGRRGRAVDGEDPWERRRRQGSGGRWPAR